MTTKDDIQSRINARITNEASLVEGSFSQDIIGAVSYELANIKETQIDTLLDRAFVLTASGDDLDKCGADYGVYRKLDTPAKVEVNITGSVGAVVNSSVKAIYNNLIFTAYRSETIPSGGVLNTIFLCETAGSIGNILANTLTEFNGSFAGLTTINNPNAGYDGFDKEDDETYRTRILEVIRSDASSGNKAHYEQWALEVAGVEKAIVKGASVMGAGQVGVYIAAQGNVPVTTTLINTTKAYIEAKQPINATLTVASVTYLNININADITLKAGATFPNAVAEFTPKLVEYLKTVTNLVSYLKISDLLFDCASINDVVSYTVNGGTSSISITDIQVPKAGTVTFA